MNRENVKRWPVLLLMTLALSVTGCATISRPSEQGCPALPPMPAASEPQPSQSYSISAQELIKAWRARLTATPVTP